MLTRVAFQSTAVKQEAFKAIAVEFEKAGILSEKTLQEPGRRVAKAIIASKSLSLSRGAWVDMVPNVDLRQRLLSQNVFAFRDGDLHFESHLAEMYARSQLAEEAWWRSWVVVRVLCTVMGHCWSQGAERSR